MVLQQSFRFAGISCAGLAGSIKVVSCRLSATCAVCFRVFFQVPKDLTYGFKLVFGAPVSGAMGLEVSATRQCDEGFGFRDCLDAVAQLAQSAVFRLGSCGTMREFGRVCYRIPAHGRKKIKGFEIPDRGFPSLGHEWTGSVPLPSVAIAQGPEVGS